MREYRHEHKFWIPPSCPREPLEHQVRVGIAGMAQGTKPSCDGPARDGASRIRSARPVAGPRSRWSLPTRCSLRTPPYCRTQMSRGAQAECRADRGIADAACGHWSTSPAVALIRVSCNGDNAAAATELSASNVEHDSNALSDQLSTPEREVLRSDPARQQRRPSAEGNRRYP